MKEECFHLGVKGLLYSRERKILLLEKQHHTKGRYWEPPGGRLQKGETIFEALEREIEEETGFKGIENISFLDLVLTDLRISVDHGDVGLVLSIYACKIGSPFTPRLSKEHINFGWFSPTDAAEHLKSQYPESFIRKIVK